MIVLLQALTSLLQFIYESPDSKDTEALPKEIRSAIGDLLARLNSYMEDRA